MANSISLNPDGYIEVVVEGDQTYMTFDAIRNDAVNLVGQLRRQGKPVLGLVDTMNEGKTDIGSNKSAFELLEAINYDKVAVFTGSVVLKEITNTIILAIGKNDNTQVFPDRASALTWLLGDQAADKPAEAAHPKDPLVTS